VASAHRPRTIPARTGRYTRSEPENNNMTNSPHRPSRRWLALLLPLAALAAGCGRSQSEQGGGMPPPEVVVAEVTRGDLPLPLEFTGRAVGSREVEVRARVDGILLERRYREGSEVREGDVLFRIDPEPYRAAVAQARAELGVAQARFEEARRQRDRIVPLFEKNATSRRQRDEAVSQFEVAQANVEAARARLRTAELDLGYTDVRAPISGLTSREVRSEGSLVQAGGEASLLTRIVQVQPIYVEFAVPESEAARIRRSTEELSARLLLDGGEVHPVAGRLSFVDTAVEPGSGTVRVRAEFENGDRRIVPGQFVRVRVEGLVERDTVAVPRRAVMSSAQGHFVWVVGADDTAQLQPVRLQDNAGELALIAEGLGGEERVVTDGVLKVQPGAKVKVAAPGAPPSPPSAGAAQ
jgi:membrane fusion protein (multidrug efflux system)